ncbi:hypothetical protein FOZ63_017910, partial [Perkinsus olseni]
AVQKALDDYEQKQAKLGNINEPLPAIEFTYCSIYTEKIATFLLVFMGFRDIALISGLGVWSVVVLLRGQLADAALCIDPSFDELFRGLRSAVVVSASDLVPAVATAAKHNLSTTDSTMRSSDVCSSDTDGPYCGPFRSAARSRQILEL